MSQDWRWPVGRTQEIADGVKDSAPGTDGLPCSFWRAAPAIYHSTVDEIMGRASAGHPLPPEVSSTSTVTIPKAEIAAGASEVRRVASTIRPITLMRVTANLSALVVNSERGLVAARSVAAPQKGILADRNIDDVVLGLDGAMVTASLRPNDEVAAKLFRTSPPHAAPTTATQDD